MGDTVYEARAGIAVLPDGLRLAYELRDGAACGAPRVVLVHSLALDHEVWGPVAEQLAVGAHVLTYDCRGHGASTRAPGPYSVEQFADDLAGLLDAVGWGAAIVGGASMGGSVAQAFATRYPSRVEGLALADTTAWYGPEAPERWEERARLAEEHGLASLVDFQLSRWFSDAFRARHPEVTERSVATFLQNDLACYAAACRMLGAFDLRAAITHVAVPTAVIVGEEDYATPPEMARVIHEAVGGSSLHIVPSTRHLLLLEQPERLAAIVRAELVEPVIARAAATQAAVFPRSRPGSD